jgi:hypothetical protein
VVQQEYFMRNESEFDHIIDKLLSLVNIYTKTK